MKVILTSFLGGVGAIPGKKEPSPLPELNGLAENLRSVWIKNARVLLIAANPDNHKKNDLVCRCLTEAFPMSGMSISRMVNCDDRNPEAVEELNSTDVLILAGGHVPTQNAFMQQLRLKERLQDFQGIVIAWSAGSMNCAGTVYASPELEGEAIDPLYQRWLPGLHLTNVNVFPHFQSLRNDYLDGLRLIEDITFADSMGHEFIALNDGSYLMIDGEKTTLYGEAYSIKDGNLTQICEDGKSIVLS